mgnify:CR=1 FL=1
MSLFILALSCAALGGVAGAIITTVTYPNTAIYVTFDHVHKDDVDGLMQAVHDGSNGQLDSEADHGPSIL